MIRKNRRGTETILRRRSSSKDAVRFQIEVINGENEDFFAFATIALVFQELVECLAKTRIGPELLYVVPSLLLGSSCLDRETLRELLNFPPMRFQYRFLTFGQFSPLRLDSSSTGYRTNRSVAPDYPNEHGREEVFSFVSSHFKIYRLKPTDRAI